MKHFLYILFSKSASKFYIGETHSIQERIIKHNQHSYKNSYSKIANEWQLSLSFDCKNRTDALFLENFIKRMKSKVFIEKIIQNREILTAILSKK